MNENFTIEEKVYPRLQSEPTPKEEKKRNLWDKMFRKNRLKRPNTTAVI